MEKIDMKKSCLNTLFAFACLLAATAVPSFGQNARLDFTAPFPFTVGNVVLPAGTYNVVTSPDGGAMFVTGSANLKSAVIMAYPAHTGDAPLKPSVAFVRRGNQYALHKIGL